MRIEVMKVCKTILFYRLFCVDTDFSQFKQEIKTIM